MISKGIKKLKRITFYMIVGAVITLVVTNLIKSDDETYNIASVPGDRVSAKVVEVIDGDTIRVATDADKSLTVRLLGIDTPELASSPRASREGIADCLAQEASDKLGSLIIGEDITLESDIYKDEYDKYDRLLAYIFVGDTNVNQQMIELGYAYEYTYRVERYKYQKEFKKAQRYAKENKLGLWSEDKCK